MILHGLVHALPGMRAADHASGWPVGPAALAVARVWRPFGWWRGLATAGAGLSLVLLALFFGPTKLLPIFAALAILATGFGFWPAVGEPMSDKSQLISDAFQVFLKESPQHARAWMSAVRGLSEASALDEKTHTLAYLAVIAALRLESGVPFHVAHAKEVGASRDEVISAILVGLPAAGNAVTHALPAALRAYDES